MAFAFVRETQLSLFLVSAVLFFSVAVGSSEADSRVRGAVVVGSVVERERSESGTNLNLDIVEAIITEVANFNGVFSSAVVLDGEEGAVAV